MPRSPRHDTSRRRPPALRVKLSGIVTAAALTAGLTTLAGNAGAAGDNRLGNGGFDSGVLSPWTCATTARPVGEGRTYWYALRGAVSDSDTAQCEQYVKVAPNATYTLSAWVKGRFVHLGVAGDGFTGPTVWTPDATDWQELTTTFTTGPTTTSVNVRLHGWYGQGPYLADDVLLSGPPGGPSTQPTHVSPITVPPVTVAPPTLPPTVPATVPANATVPAVPAP
ncbi:carbohydrate binding domain-containing protein [Kitasatospora sp. NPDC056327]|uniref:carbohydrate binding domain-containing protein n=1 Tax=Kitasatospora sp. NPDC056327 TaxID=3345785 RepID=UPI0035D6F69D